MKRYFPILISVMVVMGAALACLQTAPDSPTVDKEATANALKATEQALNLKATEQALKATQNAPKPGSNSGQVQPAAQSDKVKFYIKNNSNYAVCYVIFSPSTEPEWREEDTVSVKIESGTSQVFSVTPGIYDLMAVGCNTDVFVDEYEVEIPYITHWELTRLAQVESSGQSTCGNGQCGSGENPGNCPQDCLTSECGNGKCEQNEDAISCGWDCAFCPDGYCTGFENAGNCPQDCGTTVVAECGNGYCEEGEDAQSCGWDCAFCPDGYCTGYENSGNCPQDCGSSVSSECGNGYCESGEDAINCGYDCGFCPDGYCTGFENSGNCPQDCK